MSYIMLQRINYWRYKLGVTDVAMFTLRVLPVYGFASINCTRQNLVIRCVVTCINRRKQHEQKPISTQLITIRNYC